VQDYATKRCDNESANLPAAQLPSIPQLYCNDGTTCQMPSGVTLPGNYSKYRCNPTCVNYTACAKCEDDHANQAFCKITRGGVDYSVYRNYDAIDSTYWEFIAGMEPQAKCCLNTSVEQKYTYSKQSGAKQRSEFLQFPKRGETGLDCGRTPNTDFLQYCNIKVPVEQVTYACWKIPRTIVP